MGLDTVELVLEVEDAFAIHIADRDAEKIQTVGQLHEYIIEHLAATDPAKPAVCATARCFYRIRRALVEGVGLERGAVKPAALLADLLPLGQRRRDWNRFRRALALRVPELRLPASVGPLLALALVALPWIAIAQTVGLNSVMLGPFVVLWSLLLVFSYWLSRPLAVFFPLTEPTLGNLVRQVAERNQAWLVGLPPMSREEVWDKLQKIVCEQLGVDESKVRPEASFVNDLGAD